MGRAAYFARSLLVSDTPIKYGRKYRKPSLVSDRIIELALRRNSIRKLPTKGYETEYEF